MNVDTNVLLFGCLAVVLFDAAGSLASRAFGFKYQMLIPGSFLIHTAVGFFAASHSGLVLTGVMTALLVGFVDATVGWAVSWWIGPGRPAVEVDRATVARTVLLVTLLAVFSGFTGGVFARLLAGRTP